MWLTHCPGDYVLTSFATKTQSYELIFRVYGSIGLLVDRSMYLNGTKPPYPGKTYRLINSIFLCAFVAIFYLLIPHLSIAAVTVVGDLTHEKIAKAGEAYQGVITIANPGAKPQEARIYQTDYLFFSDGRNVYGEPGKSLRSNAGWIAFSPRQLLVPPGGNSEVNYTVRVPDDESLVGTYWSMIMVEGISEDSAGAIEQEKGKVKVGVKTVIRYGIQMVTHIGDTGTRKIKFLKVELLKEGENRTLQVDAENTGERWLRSSLWVELYDEKGNNIGKFEGERKRIYPGTSVRYRIDLSKRQLLFNIDGRMNNSPVLELQSGLDKGTIPERLLQEFKNKGILLSQNAVIMVEETGSRWLISENKTPFVIRREEGKLNIYEVLKDDWLSSKYKALVVADCGGDDLFGATYTLEIGK